MQFPLGERWVGVVLAVAVTLSACGPDARDSVGVATYPTNGIEQEVSAIDNTFVPRSIIITAGTLVVFTNKGRNPHNIVPAGDPKATTWGVLESGFRPRSAYSRVFDLPSSTALIYYCTIHGSPTAGMFGTITVVAP